MEGLIAGQDHVGDVLVDGGMEDVEDGVVYGGLGGIGLGFGGGAVNVADEARATGWLSCTLPTWCSSRR
jgi:hypothetical protein